MNLELRTLRIIQGCRQLTGGDVGARLLGVCDSCDGHWVIDIQQACDHLGEQACEQDLIGQAICQRCNQGTARRTILEISTTPIQAPVWFAGSFNKAIEGDGLATEKPRGRRMFAKKR